MAAANIDFPRLALAGLVAGLWVTLSGILMAATFGYRDMKTAFDAVGLAAPQGAAPMILHTLVRLTFGLIIVALYAIMVRVWAPVPAALAAAGFAWVLATVLPFAVIAQWGLFPWAVAAKLWTWGAAEFLIAALIGRWLYRP